MRQSTSRMFDLVDNGSDLAYELRREIVSGVDAPPSLSERQAAAREIVRMLAPLGASARAALLAALSPAQLAAVRQALPSFVPPSLASPSSATPTSAPSVAAAQDAEFDRLDALVAASDAATRADDFDADDVRALFEMAGAAQLSAVDEQVAGLGASIGHEDPFRYSRRGIR